MAKETISQTEGLCKEATTNIRNAYDKGYKQGCADGEKASKAVFTSGILKGREEAWECARKMGLNLTKDTVNKIFNGYDYFTAIKYLSASECIQKIKEYEEKQKADSNKVTRQSIIKSQLMDIVNGQENPVTADEIAEVLEQLKGE